MSPDKDTALPTIVSTFTKEMRQWRKLVRMFQSGSAGTFVKLQVPNTTNTVTYTFTTPEPDALYGIVATADYNAYVYVSARSATAFTLTLSGAAGASNFVDIIMFRS